MNLATNSASIWRIAFLALSISLAEIAADAKMAEGWNNMVRMKQIPAKAGKYVAAILLMDEKIKESERSQKKRK